ncbi:MAG: asparagine synthase (glutamine-hydrolyzing) [Ardenticatenaceae bacterium]
MCGIVGIASQSPTINPDLLVAMRDTMHHRGPDDAGVWWSSDYRIGLAQRRLAIIDLSPGGHQPMSDRSGQLWITFNGEIYNYEELRRALESRGHRFRTASDTEVILEAYRAWGVDCLSHLNGMFAFGLYDKSRQRLFLARDRAGEKPLFYRHTPEKLVFASELKALMADPAFSRTIDLQALDYYLAYGYVPGDMCMLKGVRKLPPAHGLIYDLAANQVQIWRYWELPDPPPANESIPEEGLIEELETLLLDSVRLRLIADVPVGILLSGGIDSSLVTALAARVTSEPLRTFTISFPGYGTYDEGPYARLVAQHFGTQHLELVAEPATVEILPALARQYDEPMGDSSMVPTYLVSRMIREHATVALGGDGGDELFGGYFHHSWLQQQERVRRFIPRSVRQVIRSAALRLLPIGLKGRNYLLGLTIDLSRSIAQPNLFFDSQFRRRLLAPLKYDFANEIPETHKATLYTDFKTQLQRATRVDFSTYLVDDLLVKVDRASMLTSLEVRAPWLDHRIIEFAFGRVPDVLRATERERKVLLRRLAARLLPPQLDLKRKQGFSLPLQSWFKGEWGRYIESVLSETDPGLFDQQVIQSLIAGQNKGYANSQRLFALTMFELWRREYQVALPL